MEVAAKALPSRSTQLREYIGLLVDAATATATATVAVAVTANDNVTADGAVGVVVGGGGGGVVGGSDGDGLVAKVLDNSRGEVSNTEAGSARASPVLRSIFTLAAKLSSALASTNTNTATATATDKVTVTNTNTATATATDTVINTGTVTDIVTDNGVERCALLRQQWQENRMRLSEKWSATMSATNPNQALALTP